MSGQDPVHRPLRRLTATVDGVRLGDENAEALWKRFSAWMEDHPGDLVTFATAEGFVSIHPGLDGDRPVLRASTRDAQQPYTSVVSGSAHAGGSSPRQSGLSAPGQNRRKRQRPRKKPQK